MVCLNSLWHLIYLQMNKSIGLQRGTHSMPQTEAEIARVPKPKSRRNRFWLSVCTPDRQKNLLSGCSLIALVLLLSPLKSSGQDFWQWQNPLPQGNTLRAVHAITANVIYTVGDAGAILKTTNGGSKWVVQSSGTTTRLNGAWFFDAAKGIVVGDSGTMLRTTDGGLAWSPLTSGCTNPLYAVTFVGSDTGTAVGYPGIILRTTDGGRTWAEQLGGAASFFLAVSFVDANKGIIVGSSGTILRTTNGGASWSRRLSGTTNRLHGVSFNDPTNGIAVGHLGTILRTTDGGASWSPQQSGTLNHLYGVRFIDPQTGVAVGDGGIVLRTGDGGVIWVLQSLGAASWFSSVSFTSFLLGTAVGPYGTISRTTDGGITWSAQTPGPRSSYFAVSFNGASTGVIAGESGALLRTDNGGSTWVPQNTGSSEDLQGIALPNQNLAIAVSNSGNVFRSTDFGVTWTKNKRATTLSGIAFVTPSLGFAVGRNIIQVGGLDEDRTIILRTTNAGSSWTTYSAGIWRYWLHAVTVLSSEIAVAVGDSGSILRTNDHGQSWFPLAGKWPLEDMRPGLLPMTNLHLRAVSFADTSRGLVVGDSGLVLRTTNGGYAWSTMPRITPQKLFAVRMLNAANAIAVGDSGVFLRSVDGGLNWMQEVSGTSSALYAIASTNADRTTIVGEGGTVFGQIQGAVTAIEQDRSFQSLPDQMVLGQNYPNPFNPRTTISFQITSSDGFEGSATSLVTLKILDLLGREVATLVDERMEAGFHTAVWNASGFATGVYFYRLRSGNNVLTRKLLLLK
jgi:photosystem II stability/assembly factor-like uncharacterized protein